jgi:nucleotide-binding universal stress UspA family protein
MNMRRILVAMDETPVSQQAAATARALFGGVDTEYLAINVVRSVLPIGAPEFGYGAVYPLGLDDERVGMADEEVARRATEAGLDHAEVLAEVGDPVESVVRAAEEHSVDVIVVGTHHKGFLSRLFAGSVSEGVTRHAHCPVLVVPSPDHED